MQKDQFLAINYFHQRHCPKNDVFVKDFFSKCNQIRRTLWIWSNLLKKSLMENFIFL